MDTAQKGEAWNRSKMIGQKPPLKPKDIWAILIERTVEKILLNGLVERFRRSVQAQQIKSLAKITVDDCSTVEDMMTKYSRFEHSQSDELPGTLPSVDELSADLDVVITWIDGFKKRVA